MILRPQARELLKSYLLGAASAAEREAVEELYLSDDSSVGELLRAEDDLIDDYVRETLTPGERALFEKNFLCTADRRKRLESVRDVRESLSSMAGETLAAPRPPRRRPDDKTVSPPERPRGRLALDYRREPFGRMLEWLDPAPERAAKKYETIRRGLVKIFASRGHADADDLADLTIDRVAQRAPESLEYRGDPAGYFYGVARIVLREQESSRAIATMLPPVLITSARETEETEQAHQCLEKCLGHLSAADRELLLDYYRYEGKSKAANRRNLAESLGITLNALRLRTHRVRTHVSKCVTSCLEQAKARR